MLNCIKVLRTALGMFRPIAKRVLIEKYRSSNKLISNYKLLTYHISRPISYMRGGNRPCEQLLGCKSKMLFHPQAFSSVISSSRQASPFLPSKAKTLLFGSSKYKIKIISIWLVKIALEGRAALTTDNREWQGYKPSLPPLHNCFYNWWHAISYVWWLVIF